MQSGPSDDELIDLIYAALLGETSWQCFLDRLASVFPDGRSTLFFHDAARRQGEFSLASNFDDAAIASYKRHFSVVNPWMRKAAVRPVGLGVVAEQMLARPDFLKTEFYHDYMRPLDAETAVGVTIVREDQCSFLLSILTGQNDADANQAQAEQLGRLAPHLRRAFNHYRKGGGRKVVDETVGSIFEAIGIGVLMAGANATLRSISPAGQQMLERDVGLRITPTGRVHSTCPKTNELIEAMTLHANAAPRVANTVVPSRDDSRLTSVMLIQLRRDSFTGYFEGPILVILIEPLQQQDAEAGGLDTLASVYGLTAAERKVVGGMASGLSVAEIADASRNSRETVRTQLKSVYAKAGVRRQAELVRLVGSLRSRITVL